MTSGLYSESVSDPPPGNVPSYNLSNLQLTVPAVTNGAATLYNLYAQAGALISIGSVTGADSYDGSQLTIPVVEVPNSGVYYHVVATVAGVVSVAGGMPLHERDQFDAATRQLHIPVVEYAGRVYTNVTAQVGAVISVGH
jgi:hypothetical protein